MTGRGEDRGVSEVIGFILVFSIVIIAFTFYQGIVVPDQNRMVEFDHNQAVQGQIQELRNAIIGAALGGAEQTVAIELGADYPHRTLAHNLGYSGGSLTTSSADSGEIIIENATAIDRYGETADYWNGSRKDGYVSKRIAYEPVYSRYSNAPVTSYENTLTYNDFGGGTNLSITGEALVDGKRLTLISLVGNLSEGGRDTVTVDPEAISASSQPITIRNETESVNVTFPSRLNASWWNDTLTDETVTNGGHVKKIKDSGQNQVTILLQPGETYTLRMAKIGVGSGAEEEPVRYLTLTERPSGSVFNDSSHSITVEARDRFNNPVSGVQVNASGAPKNGNFSETNITTSAEGEATFNFIANSSSGPANLRFNITPEGGGHPDHEVVWVNLSVKSSSGGGGSDEGSTSEINPVGDEQGTLVYVNATVSGTDVDLHLNNTAEEDIIIERARFQFYAPSQPGGEGVPPDSITMAGSDPISYLGGFDDVGSDPLPSSEITPVTIALQGGEHVPRSGDFMIITIETDNDRRITYFIGMT